MPRLKCDDKVIITSISWNSRELIEVLYEFCTNLWAIRITIMLGRAGIMERGGSFSLIYLQWRELTSLPEKADPRKERLIEVQLSC